MAKKMKMKTQGDDPKLVSKVLALRAAGKSFNEIARALHIETDRSRKEDVGGIAYRIYWQHAKNPRRRFAAKKATRKAGVGRREARS